MKNRLRSSLTFIVFVSLLLNACALPATHRYGMWFYFSNLGDIQVTPVTPITIAVDFGMTTLVVGPDYPCGEGFTCPLVNKLIYLVNGAEMDGPTIVGTGSDPVNFFASHVWTPPAPGLYYVQVHAFLNKPSGPVSADYSRAVQICVIGDGFTVADCWPGGLTPVPLSAPISFSTPAFTSTPASARDCPSGTFFAEQTHKCIPVQIETVKPGHGGCSQYDNASACTSNGCSWDKPSSTCH